MNKCLTRLETFRPDRPEVSVIIPNINGSHLLPECLGTLRSAASRIELILVDNGSEDESVQLTKDMWPEARVITNITNLGFAEACAQGAEIARSELLLFLNNDVILPLHSLDILIAALVSRPEVAACQPTLRRPSGELDSAGSLFTRSGFLYHLTEQDLADGNFGDVRFALKGACLLVRKSVYDSVGGFDCSYFAYFEETDLCWRMLLAGWKLVHVSDATATHFVGSTTTKVFSPSHIDYLSFRNRVTSIRANSSRSLRRVVLPLHVGLCMVIAAAFLLNGKARNALAIIKAIFWHVTNRRRVMEKRQANWSRGLVNEQMLQEVATTMPLGASLKSMRGYMIRW